MKARALFFIFILVLFLALVKILLAAKLATRGGDLVRIETQSQSLQKENLFLAKDILMLSSLGRVSQEAERAGFSQAKVASMLPQVPLAFRKSR